MKAILLGALLAAVLAGCGGGGKQAQPAATTTHKTATSTHKTVTTPSRVVAVGKIAYDRKMRPLGLRLTVSMKTIYPIVETKPGAAASLASAAKIEKTRAVVASVRVSVSAIVPPPPIRADHQRLIKGLNELGVELGTLIHVLEKGGPKPFGAYASFASLRTIDKATADIEQKGYSID